LDNSVEVDPLAPLALAGLLLDVLSSAPVLAALALPALVLAAVVFAPVVVVVVLSRSRRRCSGVVVGRPRRSWSRAALSSPCTARRSFAHSS
jgi:hypothetical protein